MGRRALFLPSVWRHAADGGEFVRHLMMKAGLGATNFPLGLEAARFRVESFGAPWRRVSPAEIAPLRIEERQLALTAACNDGPRDQYRPPAVIPGVPRRRSRAAHRREREDLS